MPHIVERRVKAQDVHVGDRLEGPNGPAVETRSWKVKYVYLTFVKNSDLPPSVARPRPLRLEVDVEYSVWREELTDEEIRVRNIERTARRIREHARDAQARQRAIRAKLAALLTEDDRPIWYEPITSLIQVDAYAEIWASLVARVQHVLDGEAQPVVNSDDVLDNVFDAKLVEITREYRQYYVDQLMEGSTEFLGRALSRSTSVVSNALEDARREALGKFMSDVRWTAIDYLDE